jgi:uncharacterized protein VirK/YbjX
LKEYSKQLDEIECEKKEKIRRRYENFK